MRYNYGGWLYYLIAVLGFDERHVIKSLLRLGFKNVNSVYLVVPSGRITRQTDDAVKRIKEVAGLAGVNRVELVEVEPVEFGSAVSKLRRLLMSLSVGEGFITVSLGGGMRAMVIEMLVATLLLPSDIGSRVNLVCDLETGEGFIELSVFDIISFTQLSYDELKVLSYFIMKGSVGPTQISKEFNIPKTTAWKLLKRLYEKGYLLKDGREYRLSENGKRVGVIASDMIKEFRT
ncbi:MAG: CRISPR-associated CARF protein Csa3 [Sulfolobales archaeon]